MLTAHQNHCVHGFMRKLLVKPSRMNDLKILQTVIKDHGCQVSSKNSSYIGSVAGSIKQEGSQTLSWRSILVTDNTGKSLLYRILIRHVKIEAKSRVSLPGCTFCKALAMFTCIVLHEQFVLQPHYLITARWIRFASICLTTVSLSSSHRQQ